MRLDPNGPQGTPTISSESDFYQRVKKRTYGSIAFERVEPSNESGFPDAYFIIKRRGSTGLEGTVEFKYKEGPGSPDLSGDLVRGTQKSALIEYHKAGGTRRFFLVYSGKGECWLFNTEDALHSILTGESRATSLANLEEPSFCAWLISCLAK